MILIEKLERFVKAQEADYEIALKEIKKGKKKSHWMWYIFPQIKGLGHSWTSDFYGIRNEKEAKNYLTHPILGQRLLEISGELLKLEGKNAREIFGYTDAMKLRSSMTLFYLVSDNDIFYKVLKKYFCGDIDQKTKELLLAK